MSNARDRGHILMMAEAGPASADQALMSADVRILHVVSDCRAADRLIDRPLRGHWRPAFDGSQNKNAIGDLHPEFVLALHLFGSTAEHVNAWWCLVFPFAHIVGVCVWQRRRRLLVAHPPVKPVGRTAACTGCRRQAALQVKYLPRLGDSETARHCPSL